MAYALIQCEHKHRIRQNIRKMKNIQKKTKELSQKANNFFSHSKIEEKKNQNENISLRERSM